MVVLGIQIVLLIFSFYFFPKDQKKIRKGQGKMA